MINMNDFINSEPYIDKIYNCTCRDCNKEFTVNVQCHPKTGAPVSFISKYCDVCNEKLRKAFVGAIAAPYPKEGPSSTNLQNEFNTKQSEFNDTILEYINKIRALLIALHIMILGLFVFDLGVVWYIIKH